jgi:hypothetical protein
MPPRAARLALGRARVADPVIDLGGTTRSRGESSRRTLPVRRIERVTAAAAPDTRLGAQIRARSTRLCALDSPHIASIITFPNPEHDTCVAPSISRAKS